MLIAIVQTLLTAAASFVLWRAWRALEGRGKTSAIITAGFLVRALASQILFWISWLRLPIGRSLQVGDGVWFFALDGAAYLGYARVLISRGLKSIVFVDPIYQSRTFTQAFTMFAATFGAVASTAILFNCAAYLATCALILRVAPPRAERARVFALAAVAFGPSMVLWSLQPLKDTFFFLLLILLVASFKEWQNLWQRTGVSAKRAAGLCALLIAATVYEIAGTRWYVSAIIVGGSLIFLSLVASMARPRLNAALPAALLFLLIALAFRAGGDADLPDPVQNAIDPGSLFHHRAVTIPVTHLLASTRNGFEATPGATSIRPGTALVAAPTKVAAVKPVSSAPLPAAQNHARHSARAKPMPVAKAPPPTTEKTKGTESSVPSVPSVVKIAKASPPSAPPPAPPPAPAAVPVVAVPGPPPAGLSAEIVSGMAAMFVPRLIAQPAGLVRIGGGRGFWLFADADTLTFDFVILFAFAYCAHSVFRKEGRVTPLFILVALVFVALAGPMIYTVTNFGTLFRLRQMLYILAALLPLTLRQPDMSR